MHIFLRLPSLWRSHKAFVRIVAIHRLALFTGDRPVRKSADFLRNIKDYIKVFSHGFKVFCLPFAVTCAVKLCFQVLQKRADFRSVPVFLL